MHNIRYFAMTAVAVTICSYFNVIRVHEILFDGTRSSSSSEITSPDVLRKKTSIPHIEPDDLIMKNARSVFVIPEYRLVYITYPKVASTEWIRLFMRINQNPKWCTIKNPHPAKENQIQTLADYSPEVATDMMTSPAWTRATIVREPKERLLSAFLDKSVNKEYFQVKCCEKLPTEELQKRCMDNQRYFESFLFFITKYPDACFDVHWDLITNKVDEKWWPYIDFIGYQDNLVEDSQRLLKMLTSTRDAVSGRTLWDRYGSSGWGSMAGCENRTNSFLEENTSSHKTDTGSHMLEWYTAETEKIAEEYLAKEWQHSKIKHKVVKLFPSVFE